MTPREALSLVCTALPSVSDGDALDRAVGVLERCLKEREGSEVNPSDALRPGQVLFNALFQIDPEFTESIRGGELDPFHVQDRFVAALEAWGVRLQRAAADEIAVLERIVRLLASRDLRHVEGRTLVEGGLVAHLRATGDEVAATVAERVLRGPRCVAANREKPRDETPDSKYADLIREVKFLKEREAFFAAALGVADGGKYRNDWPSAIQRLLDERDSLRRTVAAMNEEKKA